MKLEYYFYKCKNCNNKFKALKLRGNCYGEFLMRSETGEIAYLNSFDTPVFDEVSKIVRQNSLIINRHTRDFEIAKKFKREYKSHEDIEKSDIFQAIFGVACDLAPDNTSYEIARNPLCSSCGKNDTVFCGETHPPEFVELNVPIVTYNAWNKLSHAEKELLVDQAIKKLLAINDVNGN